MASNHIKRLQILANFGRKYLSNDGIDPDRFISYKYTSTPAKKSRANIEWNVPLTKAVYTMRST